jgi:hypothetical protein
MKKIALISTLVLMLLACSVSDVSNIMSPLFTPTALSLATKTVYVTPSDTPTITETLPTPTFTGTPTLMGSGFTATPSETESPTVTPVASALTGTIPVSAGNSLTTPDVGFTSVRISGNILRWGGCEPSSVTFTAQMVDPTTVASVTLWIRLSNPPSGEATKWEAGAIMKGNNTGTFTYTLTRKNISHYNEYPNAWLQYQIVARDANGNDVGRTRPYLNNITLARCG